VVVAGTYLDARRGNATSASSDIADCLRCDPLVALRQLLLCAQEQLSLSTWRLQA